jgi:glycogen operon protein
MARAELPLRGARSTSTEMCDAVALPSAGTLRNGLSCPLGDTLIRGGANLSVFSRTASAMERRLFDREDDRRLARTIPIDVVINRTYHCWHVLVPGVRAGQWP